MKKIRERISALVPIIVLALFALLFISIIRASIFGIVDSKTHLFFEISFLLLLAVLAEVAVIYLKQPSVILLLLIGVTLSRSFLETVWPTLTIFQIFPKIIPHFIIDEKLVEVFGQLGAIFILLKVGLHVKFGRIFNLENGLVAFMGIFVPFIIGYLYAVLNGGNTIYGMFIGAALVATSVGVTVALLKDFGLLKTKFAEVILGAAVIDDVLGLLVLSFVSVLSSGTADIIPIASNLFNSIIFLAGGVLAGNYFIKEFIDKNEMDSKNMLMMLMFAFVYAYVAEYIGLSTIVGAFLAGILLNGSRHLNEIEKRTEVLELVFAPIFFISLGMLVDVMAIWKYLVPILIITIIAILTKVVGCGLGAIAIKLNWKESLVVGVGMVPRGEVALIVGLIGLTKGVLNTEQYTVIASMSFLTAFLMPFIMQPLLKRDI